MVSASLGARLARAAALLLVLGATGLPPRWRRLNGPLPSASLGDVRDFQLVPGSARVLYLADREIDESFELYSRLLDPLGAPLRLSPDLQFFEDVLPGFRVDPTGRNVLYGCSQGVFCMPVDGSGPPQRLALPALGGEFSPDGRRLVFLWHSGQLGATESWLFSVPTDSQFQTKLSGPFDPTHDVTAFEITADSSRVVFLGDQTVDDRVEIYGVPIDGSASLVRLAGRMLDDRDVTGFRLTHDGRRVVYRSDQDRNDQFELFVVPVEGGVGRERVSPTLPLDRDVGSEFELSADDARLVFFADPRESGPVRALLRRAREPARPDPAEPAARARRERGRGAAALGRRPVGRLSG